MNKEEYNKELVFKRGDEALTNSLLVAERFNKEHRNVLRDVDNLEKDVPNFEQMFAESEYHDSYGRSQRMYVMTKDGFTLLTMGFTGAKAMKFKLDYMNQFNKMERIIREGLKKNKVIDLGDPNTILQLAQNYKEEYDKRLIAEAKVKEQTNKLEEQKPKVTFADAVTASSTSCLVGELAKLLTQNGYDTGEKRLFKWLRDNDYLGKRGEYRNVPNQRYVEQGLFEIRKGSYIRSNGVSVTTRTTMVTGKGQVYFINKFIG